MFIPRAGPENLNAPLLERGAFGSAQRLKGATYCAPLLGRDILRATVGRDIVRGAFIRLRGAVERDASDSRPIVQAAVYSCRFPVVSELQLETKNQKL